MSDISISPEDRERLAKTKFGEWFDEFFEKKFAESFDKKLQEVRQTPRQQTQQGQPPQGQANPQQPQQVPHRRRSLLEECFSQTFGF